MSVNMPSNSETPKQKVIKYTPLPSSLVWDLILFQFAGISVDMIIEQEMMKSLKTAGGPVGAGQMGDEASRNSWLYSWPIFAQINR